MMKYKSYARYFAANLAIMLVITGLCSIIVTHAATPYHVRLATSNFNLHILTASAEDLSDSSHAVFSLQNGTPLWYGITMQSNPAGLVPTAANGPADLVTTTFTGDVPLLPPAGVLPFDQTNASYHYETLKLAVAFSGPNQQIQFDLSPYESHAVTLDMFTLLLQLLGQKNSSTELGLLAPGTLKAVFDAISSMKDFESLTNDYIQALQSAPDATAVLPHAFDCSRDLVALLSDPGEQKVLADLLWKIVGKTLPYPSILKAITGITSAQFSLGMEGFIRDEALVFGTVLIQQNDPTVVVQSVLNQATPSLTPTPPSPTSPPSPTTVPPTQPPPTHPTPVPTRWPTPVPTRKPTPTPRSTRVAP